MRLIRPVAWSFAWGTALGAALAGCATRPTARAVVESRLAPYATGCMVLLDPAAEQPDAAIERFGAPTADQRRSPCSTFKIANALIALDLGIVPAVSTTFAWDGTLQPFRSWERDHTLQTAFAHSVVWYFQRLARQIGPDRMQAALDRLDYGNRDISKGIDSFWLHPASLMISPNEQVRFLDRLYADDLPLSPSSMTQVRDLMVWRRCGGWTLSGKTGSGRADGQGLGWYVGRVEDPSGASRIFATILEGDEETGGMTTRRLTVKILNDLGWWPESDVERP